MNAIVYFIIGLFVGSLVTYFFCKKDPPFEIPHENTSTLKKLKLYNQNNSDYFKELVKLKKIPPFEVPHENTSTLKKLKLYNQNNSDYFKELVSLTKPI